MDTKNNTSASPRDSASASGYPIVHSPRVRNLRNGQYLTIIDYQKQQPINNTHSKRLNNPPTPTRLSFNNNTNTKNREGTSTRRKLVGIPQ